MNKFIMACIISIFVIPIVAKEEEVIDIVAKHFKNVGNVTVITGDVKIKKGLDLLDADKVTVYTNKERKPLSYEAKGNVRFKIITEDKRELNGKSERLVYDVKKNEYRLYDNVYVKETGKKNVLHGDEIILSKKGDYANVVGNKSAPARIIFSLD